MLPHKLLIDLFGDAKKEARIFTKNKNTTPSKSTYSVCVVTSLYHTFRGLSTDFKKGSCKSMTLFDLVYSLVRVHKVGFNVSVAYRLRSLVVMGT